MLAFIYTDIIHVETELLINGANAKGYMGGLIGRCIRLNGVSKSIHYAEPSIEKQAKRLCKQKKYILGDIFHTNAGRLPFTKGVLHAVTLHKSGQKSKLQTIERCLLNIVIYCQEHNIKSVAIPFLGCEEGQLAKKDIIEIYKKHLSLSETLFLVVDTPKK